MRKQSKQELFLDHYLSSQSLWRKPIAKDGFCLFRAVSEQLFKTQAYYRDLCEACRIFFSLCGKSADLDWHETEVMHILSRMYRRDFLVYEIVGHPPYPATCNGYDKKIVLCRVDDNHLDSVYPATFVQSAAICQSVLYEILYRNVFKMDSELAEAVSLIRDQNKKKLGIIENRYDLPLSPDEPLRCSRDWSSTKDRYMRKTTPPVPYRIAKALDPCIYRNVELDIWEEEKRGKICMLAKMRARCYEIPDKEKWKLLCGVKPFSYGFVKIDAFPDIVDPHAELLKESSLVYKDKFEPGDKCRVILEGGFFFGHVQEVDYENNTAVVYVQELGQKQTVPYQNLKSPPTRHRSNSGYFLQRNYKRKQDMPVASSTNSQNSYQGNKPVGGNRYTSGYSQGLRYENNGTVNQPVHNYMAQDPIQQTQVNNNNKIDHLVPSPVLMRYTPQSLQPSVPNSAVYPQVLCVPFLDSIAVNQVNMNCLPSQDMAGKDLPEMNTLRFFFNFGIENYRAICQGGQYWSQLDYGPMVPINAVDQQNGNVCYQFTAPPPPIPKTVAVNDNEMSSGESLNQNQYQAVYPVFQGEVYKVPSEPVSKEVLTPTSDKTSNQSEKGDNVSVCNDSGCDSDSVNGSTHDDSFKENMDKDKLASSPTVDLKRNIDSFIAKSDDQIAQDADSTTTEFQVPSITKPRSKRKYYMYGNHKLIKPVKDIPPRFLSLLAENSAARARCEGEPIIIPFLPPRYNRHYSNRNYYTAANSHASFVSQVATENNSANLGTTFNPEAKCFVPGQTVVAVPSDPSIIACSDSDPSIIACGKNVEIPNNVDSANPTNTAPKYIIPYPPPNAVYIRNSETFQASNFSNVCTSSVGVGCHKPVTGDGSLYKSSMPSCSSTGAGQPCSQYGATMQSVYYTNPGSYPALPQSCVAGSHAVPGISYSNIVPNASQTYSMPPHVAQIASLQAAQ